MKTTSITLFLGFLLSAACGTAHDETATDSHSSLDTTDSRTAARIACTPMYDCPGDTKCLKGWCVELCLLDCSERRCDDHDGCGGLCGCPDSQVCCGDGECAASAEDCSVPDCSGTHGAPVECGDDGHGGTCGECPCPECAPSETVCFQRTCIEPESLSCQEISDCLLACPSDFHTCETLCVENGTMEAKQARNDYSDCVMDAYPTNCPEFDPDCIALATIEYCLEELGQCFGGDGSCHEILACVTDCDVSFAKCSLHCMETTTAVAGALYQSLVSCLVEACGQHPTQACLLDAYSDGCQPSFQACSADD